MSLENIPTPDELLDLIEQKGREVEEALAVLRQWNSKAQIKIGLRLCITLASRALAHLASAGFQRFGIRFFPLRGDPPALL